MPNVQAFYDRNSEAEWARLDRHRTEFAVTLRVLSEFLPKPPASVLDIGGGPGRYAIALASQGYAVTLVDISEVSLALAQEKARAAGVALEQVLCADALDLSAIPSATYSSVLLMGPLYHLLTEEARFQAVKEALRVLKHNGLIFAAFITRFAPFRDSAQGYPEWVVENWEYATHVLKTGVHDGATGFTNAYFAHPGEIIPFMERAGFTTLGVVGCEGIVAGHEGKINALSGEAWERWVDLNYRLGQDPYLWGAADHLLYVGRKTVQSSLSADRFA